MPAQDLKTFLNLPEVSSDCPRSKKRNAFSISLAMTLNSKKTRVYCWTVQISEFQS